MKQDRLPTHRSGQHPSESQRSATRTISVGGRSPFLPKFQSSSRYCPKCGANTVKEEWAEGCYIWWCVNPECGYSCNNILKK